MTTSKDLPAIIEGLDIEENRTQAVELVAQGKFQEVLNQNPNKMWLKNHPFASGVQYLPIDKVELMLDMLFPNSWYVEITNISQLAQSICCTVRLHYKNPITKEWMFQDGVGAQPLKTDKGASAADLSKIKNDAVMTGAPAAKSFAIKDAAEELGKLFGRDINRKDVIAYSNIYEDTRSDLEKYRDDIRATKTIEDLHKVWNKIPKDLQEKLNVEKNVKKAEFGDE